MKPWMVIAISLLFTGCVSIGPKAVRSDWVPYNDAIQNTQNQQLLKNIVRIRYFETVTFLKMTSLTTAYTLSPSIGATGTITSSNSAGVGSLSRSLGITPEISYSETPTMSYVPVTNTEFINELLSPIRIKQLSFLFYGGLHPHRTLFRLVTQSLNEMDNASSASSVKPAFVPQYQNFYHFLDLLADLKKYGYQILPDTINNKSVLVIHFDNKRSARSITAKQIRKLLDLPNDNHDIIISEFSLHTTLKDVAYLQTRSLMGIMNFLSHGVQIPEKDIKSGYAYQYDYPPGHPYNWVPLMHDLLTVYSSDIEPTQAFVKVTEHGHWFYIKDSDLRSKITFDLLNRLITLSAGEQLGGGTNSSAPVLTIPAR